MNLKNTSRHRIAIICFLVALAVVPTVIVLAIASNSDDPPGLELGTPAPNISGTTLRGNTLDLANYRSSGSWVVVNFFATWCAPCIKEHGELGRFRNEAQYPAEVISIIFSQPESKGREFFDRHGGNWPVLARDTSSIVLSYGILSVPETYLITPSGVVAAHWRGPITADDIFKRVEQLQARQPSSEASSLIS